MSFGFPAINVFLCVKMIIKDKDNTAAVFIKFYITTETQTRLNMTFLQFCRI